MLGPGIGGYQIMDCENLEPLGKKDSLWNLIECIWFYHLLNDYDGIEESIKLNRRYNVRSKLLEIAGLSYHQWWLKYGNRRGC